MPVFGPRGLEAIGVHSQAEAEHAVFISEKAELLLPMAFDLEREIVRYYRLSGSDFPLHIVVGPNGNVLHVDNDSNLDVLVAALEQILPE